MKILLITPAPPALGGLETMAPVIAAGFRDLGQEVKILVTNADGNLTISGVVSVTRPDFLEALALFRWADVAFFNHTNFRYSWEPFLTGTPYVMSMSGGLDSSFRAAGFMKHGLAKIQLQLARANIAACEDVRQKNAVFATVIPNPFASNVFRNEIPWIERPRQFLFAGRLATAKGIFDLAGAMASPLLKSRSIELTIAGVGEDEAAFRGYLSEKGLTSQVMFLGKISQSELAEQMNQHRYFVLPSRYDEPIGIAALEAIACGCIPIGSNRGGLAESIGPCGFTFPNGDILALAEAMLRVQNLGLADVAELQAEADTHLQAYQPAQVARHYLEAINRAIRK